VVRFFGYGEHSFIFFVPSISWLEGKTEAQRPPAESEVLHGNQLRGRKWFILATLVF